MSSVRYSYAEYGCNVFADNARTYAYHRWACENGMYPAGCDIDLAPCGCEHDPGVGSYTNPVDDFAPWYDPVDPSSSEFLGVIIQNVEEISDSTIQREVVESINSGSILTPARLSGRSMVLSMIMLSTSCRGADYGIEWLRRVLEQKVCGCNDDTCQACYGKRLTIRKNCGEIEEGQCDTGIRYYENTGVLDGMTISDTPEGACACVYQIVTVTMHSEVPYNFGCETVVANMVSGAEGTYYAKCFDWTEDHCSSVDETDLFGCDSCDGCDQDPMCGCDFCGDMKPRGYEIVDSCDYCEPLERRVQSASVMDSNGVAHDSTFMIEIFSGFDTSQTENAEYFRTNGLRNVRLGIYNTDTGLADIVDEDTYYEFCSTRPEPRFEFQIPYIPYNATLTIDGRTSRIYMTCGGKCRPFPYVLQSTVGKLFPLSTSCSNLSVVVEWDESHIQPSISAGRMPSTATVTSYRQWLS